MCIFLLRRLRSGGWMKPFHVFAWMNEWISELVFQSQFEAHWSVLQYLAKTKTTSIEVHTPVITTSSHIPVLNATVTLLYCTLSWCNVGSTMFEKCFGCVSQPLVSVHMYLDFFFFSSKIQTLHSVFLLLSAPSGWNLLFVYTHEFAFAWSRWQ